MASSIMALALSFFIAGLGIVYLGKATLGIGLVLLWLILCLVALHSIGLISMIVAIVALIVWAYSIFTTFFLSINS